MGTLAGGLGCFPFDAEVYPPATDSRSRRCLLYTSGPQDGSTWSWYYDLTEAQVNDNLAANNAYLTDIAPYNYWDGPQIFGHDETLMAVVMRSF